MQKATSISKWPPRCKEAKARIVELAMVGDRTKGENYIRNLETL